ncbi:MAG: cob(I)yrinic acid a,c-diamide adenosyltransferase [Gammaproteobacteria bacterium]|nr:cob(I)yrinic acid a,c-diamide adenosyltransferase [Gammaproteobacteria bacterium]
MTNKSRIYTRTGDQGSSGLANGERRSKTDQRILAIGALDELNAVLGIACSQLSDPILMQQVETLQKQIFICGAELALANEINIMEEHLLAVEKMIDHYDAALPRMTHFIFPGGSVAGATLHHARSICRRVECEVLHLAQQEEVNSLLLRYLNRLSDLLFVLARHVNQQLGEPETKWIP